jgi:hypothetical protein
MLAVNRPRSARCRHPPGRARRRRRAPASVGSPERSLQQADPSSTGAFPGRAPLESHIITSKYQPAARTGRPPASTTGRGTPCRLESRSYRRPAPDPPVPGAESCRRWRRRASLGGLGTRGAGGTDPGRRRNRAAAPDRAGPGGRRAPGRARGAWRLLLASRGGGMTGDLQGAGPVRPAHPADRHQEPRAQPDRGARGALGRRRVADAKRQRWLAPLLTGLGKGAVRNRRSIVWLGG